jgi:hypothetical protein
MAMHVLSMTGGWLVEVTFTVEQDGAAQPQLYVAGLCDPVAAVAAVRKSLAGLRCTIEPKCRFSPRALVDLGVRTGEVVPMGSRRRSRRRPHRHRPFPLVRLTESTHDD